VLTATATYDLLLITECKTDFLGHYMSHSNSNKNMGVPSDKAELTNLPLKLHALLEEAERLDQACIVSWENRGTAFKVHDKKRFVNEIMPKYFSTSNYQSFQRYMTECCVGQSQQNSTQLRFFSMFSNTFLLWNHISSAEIAIYGVFELHPKDPTRVSALIQVLFEGIWSLVER
jgi:hypothetical protein